ncbi:hypothetical protein RDI58_010349 [Solanum bulbocastanum]|uniref:dihydroneopterin aldolase n=1 Tax=Solanum bulbocastanum TaxID=147425 RepID=A0AAN8TMS7_SOLBU
MGCSLRGSMTGPMDIPKGDKLVLRGLKFHGYHGVKPEETKLGQKFLVDVDAWMDLRPAVGKPRVAVQGPVDYFGVEIIRHRDLDV